jgi:hypothetical protein
LKKVLSSAQVEVHLIGDAYRQQCYLNSSARQKVITGVELLAAEATVADVSVILALLRFMPIVVLGITKRHK